MDDLLHEAAKFVVLSGGAFIAVLFAREMMSGGGQTSSGCAWISIALVLASIPTGLVLLLSGRGIIVVAEIGLGVYLASLVIRRGIAREAERKRRWNDTMQQNKRNG